ncbi:MAG: hypothetical protein JSV03_08770, partial [Planctomycetota bacterium]
MKKSALILILIAGLFGYAGMSGKQSASLSRPITTESLLAEMADLYRLIELPIPAYTTRQFSSYDPESRTQDDVEGWFANKDRGHYLRVEEKEGRKEFVMMDADGPGAMVRIWSANPQGTLRIYLDGKEKPALEVDMLKLLTGKIPHFPEPFAGMRARGCNLYFPIPYARHCKVTSDQGNFYYHINYRTYEAGTEVVSFTPADLERLAEKIDNLARRLAIPRDVNKPWPANMKKDLFDY